MLKKLQIRNYAIIDEIDIAFSAKLNVITGETGAGKSILMGALALILGERADSSVLLNREKKCIVEGVFPLENRVMVRKFLEANDLDADPELTIRREISPNGKSRAFVNDTPVNLEQLRSLTAALVDLHQQFDSLSLGDSDFQREVLDALAGQHDLVTQYQDKYRLWLGVRKRLTLLEEEKMHATKTRDYNQFLFDELDQAALRENELEHLEEELKLLSNAEGIKTALEKVCFELKEGDHHIIQQLKSGISQLQGYSSYHARLPAILQRLQSAQIELRDIADEMEQLNEQLQLDPLRIDQIHERINLGYKLLKKHGFHHTNELITLRNQLEEKLRGLVNLDEEISEARNEADLMYERCDQDALVLLVNRQKQIDPFVMKINQLLAQVGMPNARLQVECRQGELSGFGKDTIEFFFDANKSNRFEPIHKVASGGERSRLMLCIKSLVAQSIDLPTLIFDEIDTGISGEAAKQVGILLKELAGSRQVICITHQPQIAGRADEHFLVYKLIKNESIQTRIRILTRDERIASIAEMLSGAKPTPAALQNAREMVAG